MADQQDVRERQAGPPDQDAPARGRPRGEVREPKPRERAREQERGREADRAGPPEKERKGPRWGVWILAALAIIGAVGGTIYWFSTRNLESTDDAYTDGRAITVAPQVKGIVVALEVSDNQFVRAGDVLIRIDPRDYIAARDQARGQLALAEAQLDNARLALEVKRVTDPATLAQAQAQLAAARANQVRAARDYRRYRSIDPAATSGTNVDQATAANQQASAQVSQAQAQVRQADVVPLDLGQAQAQVKQLDAQVQQAKAQLAQAELNLGYTEVAAPQDGWITKRNVERGNYVEPGGTIFSIVTRDLWVIANFKETQLNRMRPGQHVDIAVDAYPGLHLTGHVDSVQLGTGSKFSAFPPENATGNFVKIVQRVPVKIDLDGGFDQQRPLPLGISVEPTVHLR
ncbi:MAG: HlyD family secretion protein [Acidisphaera sp.]|nr:HlyD family secretion protein [Acidisphaera sp.]